MRALVTGGSGILGRALRDRFRGRVETVSVSRRAAEGVEPLDLSVEADVEAFFKKHAFDVILHGAAYSDVDGCERDPQAARASNALSTRNLSRMADACRIPLVYVSTDYVFDGRKRSPYEVQDPTHPINVYGLTKLEGEYWTRQTQVSAVVRTSWLFGDGNPKNFVTQILGRLRGAEPVRILADQTDSPTYAKDLAEALERIAVSLTEHCRAHPGRVRRERYQFCNTGETTRYGMTVEMARILGLKTPVERLDRIPEDSRPAVRPVYCVMSSEAYAKAYGARVRPWTESLREYLTEGAR